MTSGRFITLEGGEGCGKTTNLAFIESHLQQQGHEVVVTREPGGTPLAEAMRDVLLHRQDEKISVDAELLLMFAARAQHVAHVIQPALAAGKWVLCSRFTDSTYAYQGYGRGIPCERIAALEQWLLGDFRPDLTILLDLSVEVGMARARGRAELDRIEQESMDFFQRVRDGFLDLAQAHANRYAVIQADQPLTAVQTALVTVLERELV